MENKKFAKIENQFVYIMQKVKTKKGYTAIQSLKTGETSIVKNNLLKDFTNKYPL